MLWIATEVINAHRKQNEILMNYKTRNLVQILAEEFGKVI